MARVTLFSDAFTGTAADLGAAWDRYSGVVNGLQRVSDQAQGEVINAAVDCIEAHGGTLPNDQWAQATIAAFLSGAAYCAAGVGICWAAPNTVSGYLLIADKSGSQARKGIYKFTAGVLSTVVAAVNRTIVASDTISLEKIQATNTLTGYHNSTQILQGTDSAFTSGRAAIEVYPTAALTDVILDDFASGGFTSDGFGALLSTHRNRLVIA
jgi:hypothetical protein